MSDRYQQVKPPLKRPAMPGAGRPPRFNSPEEMQKIIDAYFERPREGLCPSISELSGELGFCDRYSFYEYEKKPRFTYAVKSARMRLTQYFESRPNPPGHIFMMKNLGYSDKQEINQTIDANVKGRITVEFVKKDIKNASDK